MDDEQKCICRLLCFVTFMVHGVRSICHECYNRYLLERLISRVITVLLYCNTNKQIFASCAVKCAVGSR